MLFSIFNALLFVSVAIFITTTVRAAVVRGVLSCVYQLLSFGNCKHLILYALMPDFFVC